MDQELRRRHADLSARHLRRPRRERVGDRRSGQRAGTGARRRTRTRSGRRSRADRARAERTDRAAPRRDERQSGVQVQPRRQSAPHARQTGRRGGARLLPRGRGGPAGPPPPADAQVLKFDKTGKFIKEWGKLGTAPGEFDQPHALAMDSRGRLFVGDRNNNRVQIFDQDGKFIAEWKQFSRPSGVFIDKQDNIYVADSESESVSRNHDGWRRGLRIGNAKDGTVKYLIPDPETRKRPDFSGTSAAEGVAADAQGNVYGAEVGPQRVMKYTRRSGTQ
ncbi:MAG: hypothetical protein DMG01_12045 [Acidobacteria bacterium]|nr:MAG: hypothetical protein DMG01_12045 [Acidobacteriota bacterium]